MNKDRKIKAIIRILGDPDIRKGDELVFVCPKCTHRKPKLSVNVWTDRFHCWICEWRGKNLVPILRLKGNSEDLSSYLESLETGRTIDPEVKTYDIPVLPPEFRNLSHEWRGPHYSNAMAYLRYRGLSRDDISSWMLGYCEEGEYRNRIIIPSFDDHGDLNFFVGRSFYEGLSRTYKHGNFNKDIVWNDLMLDWSRPVTVVEGPFDAFVARKNVVAMQGSILRTTSKLFRRIVISGRDVYFAMDSDALRKQFHIVETLISYGVRCLCVPLGGRKDVGEMTHDEFVVARDSSRMIESDLDLLKARIYA